MIKRGISKFRDNLVYFDKKAHPGFGIKKLLFRGKSKFQKIEVVEFYGLGRSLILDNEPQFFEADEKLYHSSFVDPILKTRIVKKVLIIGGGDGGVAREVLKYQSVKEIKIIDIDKKVSEVVKRYFKNFREVFSNPKVKLLNQDACDFIDNCNEEFDVIFVDLTDRKDAGERGYQVNRLYTLNYFKELKKLLKKDGILACQTNGYYTYPQAIENSKQIFKKAFKNFKVYGTFIPCFFDLWCFIVGSDQKIKLRLDTPKIFNIFEITEKPKEIDKL